jgi:two-component system, sensor histidine kinase
MTLDRSRSSNIAGVPFALLVCWLLWGTVDGRLLAAWFAAKTAVGLWRIWVTRGFDRHRPQGSLLWSRRFDMALVADGLVFGMLGTVLMPVQAPVLAATLTATLLGIAAIGLVVLSMNHRSTMALILPLMLPAMLYQFARGDAISIYTGLGMGIFLALVTVEGRRSSDHTREMLRLRFRMDELAASRQQALELAERSSAAKDQFLATISHEMRTPLHGILGLAREARRGDGQPSAQRDETLHTLERTGEHLLSLINDLLDFSRIERAHLRLADESFDLQALLAALQTLTRVSAAEKGLALLFDLQLPAPCWVRGDPERLRQVLVNLLGNAVKFTARGSVVLRARRDDDTSLLVVEVIDTGPGVPEGDRERIFEAFQQLDSSFSRRHGGTGLGLTISRELARAMGGDLRCGAGPGGTGASFRLDLPLPGSEPPAQQQPAPSQPAATPAPLPSPGPGTGQGLVDVPQDVVDVLQPHRHAHHVRRHAGGQLLRVVELAVRGAGRVDDQRARVADVHQVAHELRRFDELHACRHAALHAEGQQARAPAWPPSSGKWRIWRCSSACCGWSGRPG